MNYILQNFLDYHYWFTMAPMSWSRNWLIGLSIVSGVLLIAALGAGIVAAHLKAKGDHLTAQVWRRGRSLTVLTVILGLLLVWFRYEQVVFLSSRWWWALLVVWLGWRITMLVIFVLKKLPRDRAALNKKMAFEKYLP